MPGDHSGYHSGWSSARLLPYAICDPRSRKIETFEIKVRNHKKEPVEVRVVEHLA
jgi:hypothetical protein